MKTFINWWLDELADDNGWVVLGTAIFALIIVWLLLIRGPNPKPRNITHDAHLFIEVPHRGLIHHPNCPCGTKP